MKFYEKQWFAWLMLVVFTPVGVFLLWKYTKYNNLIKAVISIIFISIFISVVSGGESVKNEHTINNVQATPQPQKSASTDDKIKEISKSISSQETSVTISGTDDSKIVTLFTESEMLDEREVLSKTMLFFKGCSGLELGDIKNISLIIFTAKHGRVLKASMPVDKLKNIDWNNITIEDLKPKLENLFMAKYKG